MGKTNTLIKHILLVHAEYQSQKPTKIVLFQCAFLLISDNRIIQYVCFYPLFLLDFRTHTPTCSHIVSLNTP